ncbi:hypothetical protein [Saccharomonospora cyanea]|uniref:Uncharacterized protein n=1 Tax=Saccharomonospora cyanea NA-134 TaxID=882082 RepID=H5XNU2_9PSEU|nr:hypothetical protein [Saccharomonospora cyanea]EHR62149.1 hypothetical protein SaccyDRAFT_3314 [Saccharomonospora cyanea NA-134]
MLGSSWTIGSTWAEIGYREETLRRYAARPGKPRHGGGSDEAGPERVQPGDARSRGEGEHGEKPTEAGEDLLMAS